MYPDRTQSNISKHILKFVPGLDNARISLYKFRISILENRFCDLHNVKTAGCFV